MKKSWILRLFIVWLITSNLFINTFAFAASEEYEAELEKYSEYIEAVSGGFNSSNRVLIRVAGNTFYDFDARRMRLAGIYVVAIYNNQVVLKHHYDTHNLGGASIGFANDIYKLPYGSLVIIAVKDEAIKSFEEKGQEALAKIGAAKGLLGQKLRSSYLCIGIKGLAQGKAIEKVGMEEVRHAGAKVNEKIEIPCKKEKVKEQRISRKSGRHEGLMFGGTEAIYYIPKNFDPCTAGYLVCIHGAGAWHRPGAMTSIDQFRDAADRENLVIIAPAFDCIFNRPINRRSDIADGKFTDPKVVRDRYLCDFIDLVNHFNEHRTDLKLKEIFEFFNKRLMKRDKFIMDGHSGGGQFVGRFVFFYPELIERAAICSAGSFVFPRRDKDYPFGLRLDRLEETFGPQIKADDLKLSDAEIDQKLDKMLDLKIFIIVGENETKEENLPKRDWQGKHGLEKAKNFLEAMREEDRRLKQAGLRDLSKPYKYELHILPGVGHNARETAKKANELLFPIKENDKSFHNSSVQNSHIKHKKSGHIHSQ